MVQFIVEKLGQMDINLIPFEVSYLFRLYRKGLS